MIASGGAGWRKRRHAEKQWRCNGKCDVLVCCWSYKYVVLVTMCSTSMRYIPNSHALMIYIYNSIHVFPCISHYFFPTDVRYASGTSLPFSTTPCRVKAEDASDEKINAWKQKLKARHGLFGCLRFSHSTLPAADRQTMTNIETMTNLKG